MIYILNEKYPGPQNYKHPDQEKSLAMKELMGRVQKTVTDFSWPPEDLRWLKTAMEWPCASPFVVNYYEKMLKWQELLKQQEDGVVQGLRNEINQLTTFINSWEEKLKNYAACTPDQIDLGKDIELAKGQYIDIIKSCHREQYLASRKELKERLSKVPQVVVITEVERSYLNRRHYVNDFVVDSGCQEHNSMTQRTIDLIDEMQNLWRTRNRVAALAKEKLNKMYYTQDNYGTVPYDATVRYFAKDYVKINLKADELDKPQEEADTELFLQSLTPAPTQVDWLSTAAHLLGLFLVEKRREELVLNPPPRVLDLQAQYEFVESLKLEPQTVTEAEKQLISSTGTMLVSVNRFLDDYRSLRDGYRDKETRINAKNATDPQRLAIDAKRAFAEYFAVIKTEIETLNQEQKERHQAHMKVIPSHRKTMERMNRYIADEKSRETPDVEQLVLKLETIGFINNSKAFVDEYHIWQEGLNEIEVTSKTIDRLQKELADLKREVTAWEDFLADTIKADYYPPSYFVFFFKQRLRRLFTGSAGLTNHPQQLAHHEQFDNSGNAAVSSGQQRQGENQTGRWVTGNASQVWDSNARDDMNGSAHDNISSSSTRRRSSDDDDN